MEDFKLFIEKADHNKGVIILNDAFKFYNKKGYEVEDFKEETSGVIFFVTGKNESYNDLFRNTTVKGQFCPVYNDKYDVYENKIIEQYKAQDYNLKITEFLSKPAINIEIEYFIKNRAKDLDNMFKPFFDSIYTAAKMVNPKANDNNINNINFKKVKTHRDQEFIAMKIKTTSLESLAESSLLYEYENQF